jgi:hypothetical protein
MLVLICVVGGIFTAFTLTASGARCCGELLYNMSSAAAGKDSAAPAVTAAGTALSVSRLISTASGSCETQPAIIAAIVLAIAQQSTHR